MTGFPGAYPVLLPLAATVLLVFLASLTATRLALSWLRHRQILDHPNERSSHSLPTPRGGGLAVTPVTLAAWAALIALGMGNAAAWPVLAGAAGLMALSWIDDRRSLPAGPRFLAQIAAAAVGLAALPEGQMVLQGLLPVWADRILAGIAWVWFVNLYNFMDGIDGITGSETLSIGLGLTLVALVADAIVPGTLPFSLALAAAAAGFLYWNWHPAKIFLGDAGSIPLGYLLGWLLLTNAAAGLWAPALILPAYYLADATITITRRALRGEKIWQAHRQHFYQHAARAIGHAAVSRAVLIANALLAACALTAAHNAVWPALAAAAAIVAVLLGWMSHMGRRPAKGARA